MLMQGRGKMHFVLVILLSDVLFFLQENNNKYSFFTPDNKVSWRNLNIQMCWPTCTCTVEKQWVGVTSWPKSIAATSHKSKSLFTQRIATAGMLDCAADRKTVGSVEVNVYKPQISQICLKLNFLNCFTMYCQISPTRNFEICRCTALIF